MKPAFKIIQDESGSSDGHVLIELAHHSISILWFKKDPLTVNAVSIYNFSDEIGNRTLIENCRDVISENNIDSRANVQVFYNFKESILIPAEFMHRDIIEAQLNLLHGVPTTSVTGYDEMLLEAGIGKEEKMYCVYRIPAGIRELVEEISSNKPRHSTSVQVKPPGTNVMQCTIFHNTVKMFLYNNNQLLIVQQCSYKTPADVAYHLLNTCDKYSVSPTEVNLYIDGLIDSESSLYQEIYKYFLNVHFSPVSDDIFLSPGIKEHPLHFISHLTELAKCV